MYYAIKEVDGKQLNKIYDNWNLCKELVLGKTNALYRGCESKEAAEKFLQSSVTIPKQDNTPKDISVKEITVSFVKLRFKNESGYTIGLYKTSGNENVVCTGNGLPLNAKINYVFHGKYEKTKYGYNFNVNTYEVNVKDNAESIIAFLSSGFIKGIGKKKATDIYNYFGEDTLDILENDTDRLLEVPGISQRTFEKVKESYIETKGARRVAEFLLSYGLPTSNAVRLYKKYGITAVEHIKENPYILCFYRGITFEDADIIAEDANIELNSKLRAEFCAKYILHIHEKCGDTAMPLKEFGLEMYKRLNRVTTDSDIKDTTVTKEWVNSISMQLVREGIIIYKKIDNKEFIISTSSYNRDTSIAENLIKQKNKVPFIPYSKADSIINKAQSNLSVKLDDIQTKAVKKALTNRISIIYGRPGTGKTTIINTINEAFKISCPDMKRIFLAPTGRAKQVLKEAVEEQTYTIHSFFHIKSDEVMCDSDEDTIVEDAVIIIDEGSMIDASVAQFIFEHIGKGCVVVLLGDPNQLESVGAGAFFRDIIESGVIPKTRLENIYRQDADSQIYQNIEKIERGNTNLVTGKEFEFFECDTLSVIRDKMAKAYIDDVEKYGLKNVLCLCPYKEHTAGFIEMNNTLQEKINPETKEQLEVNINGYNIRINDLVMHIRTNNELCNNGDIGIVKDIIKEDDSMVVIVDINDNLVEYEGEELQNLTLAYAMSVHKSQGSQVKAVVTCLSDFHSNMLIRNIPYVAISRGKLNVKVFGSKQALITAIKNDKKRRRNTTLTYQLKLNNSDWIKIA